MTERFNPVCSPVAITDETHPEIALARAGLAAMSPEERALREKEWNDG